MRTGYIVLIGVVAFVLGILTTGAFGMAEHMGMGGMMGMDMSAMMQHCEETMKAHHPE